MTVVLPSFAEKVKSVVPAVVGVPEIAPVAVSNARPAGSVPVLTLYVTVPVAFLVSSVAEYA